MFICYHQKEKSFDFEANDVLKSRLQAFKTICNEYKRMLFIQVIFTYNLQYGSETAFRKFTNVFDVSKSLDIPA